MPSSTTQGWGAQLTRSQATGQMRGLGLLWGQRKHLGPEQVRQDRDEVVAVQRDGCGGRRQCPSLETAHATARRTEGTLGALSGSSRKGNSARAVGR